MSKTKQMTADVLIAGGGMVGLSLASLLPSDLTVVLVDQFPLPDSGQPLPQPSFDARSTALSYQSLQIFDQVGLGQTLRSLAEPIATVHVSSQKGFASTQMEAQEQGWEALGYVIENTLLGRSLLDHVQSLSHITLLCPSEVKAINVQADQVKVQCGQGLSLAAKLVVIADGAHSSLSSQLGIEIKSKSFDAFAVITNVALEEPHQGIAYERFTPEGPLALLPLPDCDGIHRAALIWTMGEDAASHLMDASDQAFIEALEKAFGKRLGVIKKIGEKQCYSLEGTSASEQARHRLVVLGNAAHTLHPVAGQGFNLALRGSERLANTLKDAMDKRDDIGALSRLLEYAALQADDRTLTRSFSDNLPAWFQQQLPSVQIMNSLGFALLDTSKSLKRRFVDFSAGRRLQ